MSYVDEINCRYGGNVTKMYSTAGSSFKKKCMQNNLTLQNPNYPDMPADKFENYTLVEVIIETGRTL